MFGVVKNISEHAVIRMLERIVLSQNIKFTERKKKFYKNDIKKKMNKDISEARFYTYSNDREYLYVYSPFKNGLKCNKYVISSEGTLVTSITDIDITDEIKKYNVYINKSGKTHNIQRIDEYMTCNYIYFKYKIKNYLIITDKKTSKILSIKEIEELRD